MNGFVKVALIHFQGLVLIGSVSWLAYVGRISDQLAGAVFGAAATYVFHIGLPAGVGNHHAPAETKEA